MASNTWSCGTTGPSCTNGAQPTRGPTTDPFSCAAGVDISSPSTGAVQALTPTCCN